MLPEGIRRAGAIFSPDLRRLMTFLRRLAQKSVSAQEFRMLDRYNPAELGGSCAKLLAMIASEELGDLCSAINDPMRFYVSIHFAALLIAGITTSTLAQPLSLDQCVAFALNSHPVIKAREQNYCAAVDQSDIAYSYLGPEITGEVDYVYIDEPRSVTVDLFSGPVGDRLLEAASFFEIARQAGSGPAIAALNDLNGPAMTQTKQALAAALPAGIAVDLLGRNFVTSQIALIQPLYTGGKITARYQQALQGAKIARQDIHTAENEIAYGIAQAYYTVVLSGQLARVSREAGGYSEGVEAMANSLVDAGDLFVTTADVSRAKTFQALYDEQAVGMEVAQLRALTALKLAMGQPQEATVEVGATDFPADEIAFDLGILKSQAIDNRPELRKIDAAYKVATLERQIRKAEFLPNVGAFASYNTITDDANFANPNDPTEWALGVTATLPIYANGRRVAQVRQANHEICEVNEQRIFLRRMVEQQVEDAYLELEEMSRRTRETIVALKSAAATESNYRAQYEAGLIEPEHMSKYYENLLTSRLLLLTAQVRYLQVRFGYNVAVAKLKFAVGVNPRAQATGAITNEAIPEALTGRTAADPVGGLR
jgi:outer membrane protein TolC